MAKGSYIGVEIGQNRLKIAETRNRSLIRFAVEDMPDDIVRQGEVIQWEAMSEFLRDSVKKNGFTCRRGALVVPDALTFTRRVRMPAMTAAQLEVNLPFEFYDFITGDKDKYIYDYAMVGLIKDEEDNVQEMDVFGAAVSKELMDNYKEMFRKAGLKLIQAAPDSRAAGNVFHELQPESAESDFAILDLGGGESRVDIYSHGIYSVTRSIETGTRAITEAIADYAGCDRHIAELYLRENRDGIQYAPPCTDLYGRIAIDVMRAVNYYTFENPNNSLETIYYWGGGARITPLIEEIAGTVALNLKPVSDLSDEPIMKEALMNGLSATGICWNEA